MPDGGDVCFHITSATKPFTLKLRIPQWVAAPLSIIVNNKEIAQATQGYFSVKNLRDGDTVQIVLLMTFKVTRYTGSEELVNEERYALEYSPLLYAAMGCSIVHVAWDVVHPEEEFEPISGKIRKFRMKHDNAHEFRTYIDIHDEQFSVYPITYKKAPDETKK